jgi:intracellular septation protein A
LSESSPTPELPSFGALVRKGVPAIVEGTVVPLIIFYVAMWATGMWGALIAALAWSYLAILRRYLKGDPVPGLVVLGALALSFRTALSMSTGSIVLYFLQPSLGTALVGLVFVASLQTDQPLIQRLARDFLPVPDEFFERAEVRTFFRRISPLWALTMLANAALTAWMLFGLPVSVFLIARTVVSGVLIAATIGYSMFGLRRLLSPAAARIRTVSKLRLIRSTRHRGSDVLSGLGWRIGGLTPQFAMR